MKKTLSMTLLFGLTVMAGSFAGCDFDNESNPVDPGPTSAAGMTFMPLAVGNSWTYEITSGNEGQINYLMYVDVTGYFVEDGIKTWEVVSDYGAYVYGDTLVNEFKIINDTLTLNTQNLEAWEPLTPQIFLESAEEGDYLYINSSENDYEESLLVSRDTTITTAAGTFTGCCLLADSSYDAIGNSGDVEIYIRNRYFVPNVGMVYMEEEVRSIISDVEEVGHQASMELVEYNIE